MCGSVLLSQRDVRYHRRSCVSDVSLQSLGGRKTNSVIETQDQNHSSLGRSDINHLTHTSGTSSFILDFDIRPPIKTPKPSEGRNWKTINEHFTMLHASDPIFRPSDSPSSKLLKINNFTYSFFEYVYGCKELKEKPAKRQNKDPEKKKLRKLKRELKKEWKRNKGNDCVDELKRRFFKVTKLLNIIRKQESEVQNALSFQKETNSFRKNPQKFAKKLYDNKQNLEPKFTAQNAQDYFKEIYSDSNRGMTYQHPPTVSRPPVPTFPFKNSPPTKEEIITSLMRKRNGAAPGPNGIPYLVYKKIPFLQHHLIQILQEMWPNFELPQSQCGITGLIYKSGTAEEASNYRPVTMTNTDGKILLSVLASRALSYMKGNGYYDLAIQKGFINDMAGCAEHITMLSELLKNAKHANRQITVCWTDLENAFGSLRHDLIQFSLDWYHFPEEFRQFVHAYYEGLYIKIKTRKWITEPVALLKGIFQGCPLSVQLFNIVWNIALDMVQSTNIKGYSLKEAGIEKQQMAYVDDHTVVTSSPEDAQGLLDTLDDYFVWTECMKAKPHKCRSLSFKVFRKGFHCDFTPVSETRYSAYDPKLSISGEVIPFLGEEPFKFLGRKITSKKDKHGSDEIQESLKGYLEVTDKASITGPMKVWLYNNYIIAFVTWPLTVYDLPISFAGKLKTIATKYLKKWLGLAKSTTESALYRSKDHFGLGLTDLVTHMKKMQVCRMHMLKYSQDDSSQKLYQYMKERDKPPVNGLGIPLKAKVWKPTNALETAERNFYLDNIAFNHKKPSHVNKSSEKVNRHNILQRVMRDDEEVRLTKCYGYAVQGDWLNFDAVLKADLSWNTLIYSLPQELFKFLLNSTHNVLPTADNLRRWGKTVVDMKCSLCGFSNPTLKHILNGCTMALKQGRYTWRHDSILSCIVQELLSFLENVNSCSISNIRDTFIPFVKEGKKPVKKRTSHKSGSLFTANDWVLAYDNPSNPLVIPHHIVQTSLRPDIIIYSNATKQIIILELTVPTEDNIFQRHSDKENKYDELLDDVKMSQWTGHVFAIEVGSRGYVAKSLGYALRELGLKQSHIQKLRKSISLICLRCSYAIYLSRKNEVWRSWESQHTKYTRSAVDESLANPNSSEAVTFSGFEEFEIEKYCELNKRKLFALHGKQEVTGSFDGFKASDVRNCKSLNKRRINILTKATHKEADLSLNNNQKASKAPKVASHQGKTTFPANSGRKCKTQSLSNQNLHKPSGLVNLGNSCYLNSVMQCLCCLASLTGYFVRDTYLADVDPLSLYGGMLVREVGAAFKTMLIEREGRISLRALKNVVGELHHQFKGCRQQDSHEFLMFLFTWLREELALHTLEGLTREKSMVDLLFQGEHSYVITCGSCLYESTSQEPFTVLTLPIPASGECTLASLLENFYQDCSIEYCCPACSRHGFSSRKTIIQRLPPFLIIHLNRFEYNVSARKKQNYIDFPLGNLVLQDPVSECEKAVSYSLCAVVNHYGTMNSGHYTSYCKPPQTNLWYHCDDDTVTILKKTVKTSAAYLLFYETSSC